MPREGCQKHLLFEIFVYVPQISPSIQEWLVSVLAGLRLFSFLRQRDNQSTNHHTVACILAYLERKKVSTKSLFVSYVCREDISLLVSCIVGKRFPILRALCPLPPPVTPLRGHSKEAHECHQAPRTMSPGVTEKIGTGGLLVTNTKGVFQQIKSIFEKQGSLDNKFLKLGSSSDKQGGTVFGCQIKHRRVFAERVRSKVGVFLMAHGTYNRLLSAPPP